MRRIVFVLSLLGLMTSSSLYAQSNSVVGTWYSGGTHYLSASDTFMPEKYKNTTLLINFQTSGTFFYAYGSYLICGFWKMQGDSIALSAETSQLLYHPDAPIEKFNGITNLRFNAMEDKLYYSNDSDSYVYSRVMPSNFGNRAQLEDELKSAPWKLKIPYFDENTIYYFDENILAYTDSMQKIQNLDTWYVIPFQNTFILSEFELYGQSPEYELILDGDSSCNKIPICYEGYVFDKNAKRYIYRKVNGVLERQGTLSKEQYLAEKSFFKNRWKSKMVPYSDGKCKIALNVQADSFELTLRGKDLQQKKFSRTFTAKWTMHPSGKLIAFTYKATPLPDIITTEHNDIKIEQLSKDTLIISLFMNTSAIGDGDVIEIQNMELHLR